MPGIIGSVIGGVHATVGNVVGNPLEPPSVQLTRSYMQEQVPQVAELVAGLKKGELSLDQLPYDERGPKSDTAYLAAAIYEHTEGIPASEMPRDGSNAMREARRKAADVVHSLENSDYNPYFKENGVLNTVNSRAAMAIMAEGLTKELPKHGFTVDQMLQPSGRSRQEAATPQQPSWRQRVEQQAAENRIAPAAGLGM